MSTVIYYTLDQLTTIKLELNTFLVNKEVLELQEFKTNYNQKYINSNDNSLLNISNDIIQRYKTVTSTTDGILNNIKEVDLQILITKIYTYFNIK